MTERLPKGGTGTEKSKPTCKNCKRENYPPYVRKYHGYCFDCWNLGVPEFVDEIAALRAVVKAFTTGHGDCLGCGTLIDWEADSHHADECPVKAALDALHEFEPVAK